MVYLFTNLLLPKDIMRRGMEDSSPWTQQCSGRLSLVWASLEGCLKNRNFGDHVFRVNWLSLKKKNAQYYSKSDKLKKECIENAWTTSSNIIMDAGDLFTLYLINEFSNRLAPTFTKSTNFVRLNFLYKSRFVVLVIDE